jgi:hypothetical protein
LKIIWQRRDKLHAPQILPDHKSQFLGMERLARKAVNDLVAY